MLASIPNLKSSTPVSVFLDVMGSSFYVTMHLLLYFLFLVCDEFENQTVEGTDSTSEVNLSPL
jgi:hypothetical protein